MQRVYIITNAPKKERGKEKAILIVYLWLKHFTGLNLIWLFLTYKLGVDALYHDNKTILIYYRILLRLNKLVIEPNMVTNF